MNPAELDRLPTRPGVYLFRGAEGEILYVGKARALRARVRSYFRQSGGRSIKTAELVRRIASVETIVVGSEAEALILEANLIKEHRPRFNVQLRDDKRYPWIRITVQEPFPRIHVTRRIRRDGARYFGPFPSVGKLRATVDLLARLHRVRSCRYDLPREAPPRPCLDHHIGRCDAPCAALQTEASYRRGIDRLLRILEGDVEGLRSGLEAEMLRASAELDFEEAARLRDSIEGLDLIAREQRVQRTDGGDEDVIGFARDGARANVVVLRIRGGVLLGREVKRMAGVSGEEEGVLLGSFASAWYLGRGASALFDLPRTVLFPHDFPDRETLEGVLSERADRRIELAVPRRGDRVRLLRLAAENARQVLEDRRGAEGGDVAPGRAEDLLFHLQERLGLQVVPRRIVGFDISHTQGSETVASAVTFENGEPFRGGYRRMRIRGEKGNDDYGSMTEAVSRYAARLQAGKEPPPDLFLIDGGKGQLGAALRGFEEPGVPPFAVVALAKREEELHLPGRSSPLRLSRRDPGLHLLQRVRDEAHRFALSYNRRLRTRRTIESGLAEIPGVGKARQQALLARFGSLRGVRSARVEEIARLPGFGEVLAVRILTWLGGDPRIV